MTRLLALATVPVLAVVALTPSAPSALPPVPVATVGTQFVPPVMVVPLGVPVTWTYLPPLPHTITTADNVVNAFLGVPNDPNDTNCRVDGEPGEDASADTCNVAFLGGTFTHVFGQPGTYYYFCAFHNLAGMVGVLQVV